MDGAYYQLHGNNGLHGSGNPRFFEGEIITSSKIVGLTIQEGRFLFKTQNSIYSCEILDHLNERFEWLHESALWEDKLPEEEWKQLIKQFEQEMKKALLRRGKLEVQHLCICRSMCQIMERNAFTLTRCLAGTGYRLTESCSG